MSTDRDIVERLREEARDAHAVAWNRSDGGQSYSIGAMLADATVILIEQQAARIAEWQEQARHWEDEARAQHARADHYAAKCGSLADHLLEADASFDRLEQENKALREAVEAANYLIGRYRLCHASKAVRDLDEAEEAYSIRLAALTKDQPK